MMVKDAKYVDNLANRNIPSTEPQVIGFKSTKEKEEIPSKVAQVKATGLNNDEMALIIKRFMEALKGHKKTTTTSQGGSMPASSVVNWSFCC
jgi:2,3-bisphosphoglycerate-independent phosphoglycerate mutase